MMGSPAVAQDCTLDQSFYQQQAQALAASRPGALYEAETGFVHWSMPDLGRVSVRIGGCQHFGLEAVSERSASQPSSPEQAIAIARYLVLSAWPAPNDSQVAIALAGTVDITQTEDGSVVYRYPMPGVEALTLEQTFAAGIETLRVRVIFPT
ncbi:MAG TPA: hypothetical protein V6C88_08470 [Chroococcidiopsis sp.]